MSDAMEQQLNDDVENLSITQLNELGNQSIKLGLIAGHGHHQGQYEIIREGKILTMTPKEAMAFLQQLTHVQGITDSLLQKNDHSGYEQNVDQPDTEEKE